jgi:hypothetical protein
VHPALYSWREDLPSAFVRALAVFCALVVLSVFSAWIFQAPTHKADSQPAPRPEWIEVDRPFPAFTLSIPEAADGSGQLPLSYAIRRHAESGGRIDILTLGAADGPAPSLHIEVYRPGTEVFLVRDTKSEIGVRASELGPVAVTISNDPVETKFGAMPLATFLSSKGTPRRCVAFNKSFDDPRLQIFGWFCQGSDFGGENFIEPATLACALDRFSLLSAGNEPKFGALFAQAELHRSFCGQRSMLLAPTPKHAMLWKAVEAKAAR